MMHKYELSHIGEFHINHNEDAKVSAEIGANQILIAVMDGCSSGNDSHFIATLIGKILRKIAKQESYLAYVKKEEKQEKVLLEQVALKLFQELSLFSNQLDLRADELFSTLILSIVNTANREAELLIVGDGVINANGQYHEYENDNKPDYIGYHLKMDAAIWLQTKTERLSLVDLTDLTISTDGIHTFKNFDGEHYPSISEERIRHLFFTDLSNTESPLKLKKTLLILAKEYGLKPSDDLTLIRLLFSA